MHAKISLKLTNAQTQCIIIGWCKLDNIPSPFCLSRTTTSLLRIIMCLFVAKWSSWKTKWDLWYNWTTLWRKRTPKCWSLLMSFGKFVSSHQEASASGGSFAPQGGLIARHNLAFCVSRPTCLSISTNLSSGWFYQDNK